MELKQVKIGQIGFGLWGSKLFNYFSGHPGFSVERIAIRDMAKQRDNIKWGLLCNSIDPILKDPSIKAVVVATPAPTHFEIAKKVLESGKHLFIEKPFVRRTYEAAQLKTIADHKNVKILVDYTFTFSAAIAQMKDLIESGAVGEISAIHMAMQQFGLFYNEDVYELLGSHMLAVLNMLFPLNEFAFVRHNMSVRDGLAEKGILMFRHSESALSGEILLSVIHPEKERKIVVNGCNGMIFYDMLGDPSLKLVNFGVERRATLQPVGVQEQEFRKFNENNNLALAVDRFYRTILGIAQSNVDDAIRITKVLERARRE